MDKQKKTRANDELKPCPFCGGKVELHPFRIANIYGISCPDCGSCYSNNPGESKWGVTKAWNRRTEPPKEATHG